MFFNSSEITLYSTYHFTHEKSIVEKRKNLTSHLMKFLTAVSVTAAINAVRALVIIGVVAAIAALVLVVLATFPYRTRLLVHFLAAGVAVGAGRCTGSRHCRNINCVHFN